MPSTLPAPGAAWRTKHPRLPGNSAASSRREAGGPRPPWPRLQSFTAAPMRNPCGSIPSEGSTRLVLDDTCFEEVALFLEIDHLAHPWKRVGRTREERFETDLHAAAAGNEVKIFLEHGRVGPEHATRPVSSQLMLIS